MSNIKEIKVNSGSGLEAYSIKGVVLESCYYGELLAGECKKCYCTTTRLLFVFKSEVHYSMQAAEIGNIFLCGFCFCMISFLLAAGFKGLVNENHLSAI